MNKNVLNDFFNFRLLVSFSVVKYLYIVGAVLINLSFVFFIFAIPFFKADFYYKIALLPLSSIVVLITNIIWRLICEQIILMFSIHEILSKQLKRKD